MEIGKPEKILIVEPLELPAPLKRTEIEEPARRVERKVNKVDKEEPSKVPIGR